MSIQIQSTDDAWTERQRQRHIEEHGPAPCRDKHREWWDADYAATMRQRVLDAIGDGEWTIREIMVRADITEMQAYYWARKLWADLVLIRWRNEEHYGYYVYRRL